jgi:hypothetical protein
MAGVKLEVPLAALVAGENATNATSRKMPQMK